MKTTTTRIAASAAVAGLGAMIARRLVPKAHAACRTGCSQICGHAADETPSKPTVREVEHA